MCGIVGYIGGGDAPSVVMEGLARVEYRGNDSAGLATITPSGALKVHKREGKLRVLEAALPKRVAGRVALGHTRWATHGEPSDANAHPHTDATGTVAVVHNGIIENAAELRSELEAAGIVFRSETDTEVLAHLIGQARAGGAALEDAVRQTLARVEGTYGLLVIDAGQPDRLVAARNGSPVIIGIGDREMLVASDVAALVRHTTQVAHLDDREMAVLSADGYRTFALDATPTQKRHIDVDWSLDQFERGTFDHFMRKEIGEQPEAIERALRGRLDDAFATTVLGGVNLDAREALGVRRVKFIGCGSAYYAGIGGAQLVEALARIPSDAEAASEFRYRNPVIEPDVLYVAVSQSGETADTFAAVSEVRRKGGRAMAVVNVVGSSIAREVDGIYLHAGPEVSVASTKVFTSMLTAFALLAVHLGRIRDLGPADGTRLLNGLRALPDQIRQILDGEAAIVDAAHRFRDVRSMFFIGRDTGFPIALEGAQKLKEISYVHAEAYPASELKHGPLALVSSEFPVVALMPDDHLVEKNVSSVRQVRARSGPTIGVVQSRGARLQAESVAAGDPLFDHVFEVPASEPELAPVLMTIPLQLFAYHLAVALGRDVDQPRNLAKSVTVE